MKRFLMAGTLIVALAGQAFAFGDSGLWGDGGSTDSPSYGVSQYWDDRQDRHLAEALNSLGRGPIEPGHIPYPCGFNQGNARAKASCQRDWTANNPNTWLWEGIK